MIDLTNRAFVLFLSANRALWSGWPANTVFDPELDSARFEKLRPHVGEFLPLGLLNDPTGAYEFVSAHIIYTRRSLRRGYTKQINAAIRLFPD
jgi:hypothetical protein